MDSRVIFTVSSVAVIVAFASVVLNFNTIAPMVQNYIDPIFNPDKNITANDSIPPGQHDTEEGNKEPENDRIVLSEITDGVDLIPKTGGGGGSPSISGSSWNIPNPYTPSPSTATITTPPSHPLNDLTIFVFDVGSDSYFIDTAGDDVLTDAGTQADGLEVLQYLAQINKTKIDVLVTSHHAEKHMDGLIPIMDALPVTWVFDSGFGSTGLSYPDYISRASTKNFTVARRGQVYRFTPNITLEILGPNTSFADEKDNSLVYRLIFGDFKILFTGDCRMECQQDLVNSGLDISADVLKAPDHGSVLLQGFLDLVSPATFIISLGNDIDSTGVSQSVLDMVAAKNIVVYRTDTNGNIVVTTNGLSYQVLTEH